MKKIFYAGLLLLVTVQFCTAQVMFDYSTMKSRADSLYFEKLFSASAIKYGEAFNLNPKKVNSTDLYNASCAWALAGNADSSFLYLEKATGKKYLYSNLSHILSDSDLESLHNDKRWDRVIRRVESNYLKAEKKLNKELIAILDSIYDVDQGYRSKIDSVQSRYGINSIQKRDLFKSMMVSDSLNVVKIKQIIKKYGWPGIDVVGEKGNKTIWLVIQHADLNTQVSYLPMLKKSVELGKSKAWYLALTEDRIALGEGRKQIYGSQYEQDPITGKYNIYPIADEIHVNERRKSVGLPPLEIDAKNYGIDYKLPQLY